MSRVFRARWLAVCEVCQANIERGHPVAYDGDGKLVHQEHHDDRAVREATPPSAQRGRRRRA